MPDQALERLLEGNRRFAGNKANLGHVTRRPIEVAPEQEPFAMVFSCVDRVCRRNCFSTRDWVISSSFEPPAR